MRLGAALLVASLCCAVPSAAQEVREPSAADRATARQLLDDGDTLMEKGDVKGALEKYLVADGLMGVPTTGLALASAQVKLGQLIAASDSYARVVAYPVRPKEPQAFEAARSEARAQLEAVRARIPSITVKVVAASEAALATAVVAIDGVEVPAVARWAPRLTDPRASRHRREERHVARLDRGRSRGE
jgi:hypothetical protein